MSNSGATISELSQIIADKLGLECQRVDSIVRALREAGMLPKGRGGRNGAGAAKASTENAADILLGAVGTDGPTHAVEECRRLGELTFFTAYLRHHSARGTSSMSVSDLMDENTADGDAAREIMLIHHGQTLRDVLAGYIRAVQGDAPLDVPVVRVTVSRRWPAATITLGLHSGHVAGVLHLDLVFMGEAVDNALDVPPLAEYVPGFLERPDVQYLVPANVLLALGDAMFGTRFAKIDAETSARVREEANGKSV